MTRYKIKDFPNTVWENHEDTRSRCVRHSVIKHTSEVGNVNLCEKTLPVLENVKHKCAKTDSIVRESLTKQKIYNHKKFQYKMYSI